ncbi:hypothetical protein [Streptomyces hygroscopicus]|uniref:hypothetical protein n=1 Tax=Streptomyces hygroscopicus TaxID=1912 RepID=UPI0033E84338
MTQTTPPHDEAATVGPRCGNNPNARLTDSDRKAITEFKAYLANRAAEKAPVPDTMTVNRAQLAALLAHHADVIASRWRAVAPGAGAWEVAAALSLTGHADELTAEEESPATAELLDAMLGCPIEPAPTSPTPLSLEAARDHQHVGTAAARRVATLKAALAEVLRIVADWCTEANDVGGVDATDLAFRLEHAGHQLPGEEPAEGPAR